MLADRSLGRSGVRSAIGSGGRSVGCAVGQGASVHLLVKHLEDFRRKHSPVCNSAGRVSSKVCITASDTAAAIVAPMTALKTSRNVLHLQDPRPQDPP